MKDYQLLFSLSENHSLQKWTIQKHSKPCDEVHFFQECPTPVQWKRRFEESFHDVATAGLQFAKFEDKFASSFRTTRRTFRRKAGKLGKSEFGESKVDISKFFSKLLKISFLYFSKLLRLLLKFLVILGTSFKDLKFWNLKFQNPNPARGHRLLKGRAIPIFD